MTAAVTEFQFHLSGTKVHLSPVLDFFDGGMRCRRIATAPNFGMVMGMMDKLRAS